MIRQPDDMESTTLCIYRLINMWLMLVTQVQSSSSTQKAYAAFPHVAPDTLQYFQYESVSFTCEGFDSSLGWKLMRKIPSENMACGTNWGVLNGSLCVFRNVYVEDSGQYWCETRDGKRSNTVNITVTAGSVIMESPVLPVMEGDDVTLRCKSKAASSSISASFYKNGLLVNNEGKLTICNVSRSDEGLYKCSISDGGESPESRLLVKEYPKEALLCYDQLPVLLYVLMRTAATVLWMALLILVLRTCDKQG